MPSFEHQKSKALNDYAASVRVGDVDGKLIPVLDLINSLDDFYTTSSCSGRITLLEDRGGKGLNKFLGKWHRHVTVEEVLNALHSGSGTAWFKCEPPILHVIARTPEKADRLLHEAREAGFKRSGLQSLNDGRNVLELLSTEVIHAPVMAEGEVAVTGEYLKLLVDSANLKLDDGAVKLRRLEERIKSGLK
jgi:tRNA wybutosine-synthesizing protein 3